MSSELIVNLWAFYDASSGVIYALSGRVYNSYGSDEQKLKLLKELSATDYITAKKYEVPERFSITDLDGSVKQKVTSLQAVNNPDAQLFNEVFKNIEADLPVLFDFAQGEPQQKKQKLPENPLCAVTVLYESETGEIKPIISDEDREWITHQETLRVNRN